MSVARSTAALRARLRVLRQARGLLAERTELLAAAISPDLPRTTMGTLTAEILPLLSAMQFLEKNAEQILRPRFFGGRGLPFWIGGGVRSRVERVPFGHVLILGPANFPLFLPGVQAMQALAAGNRVTWKPGRGGEAVARIVADALFEAGLAHTDLTITDDSIAAAEAALAAGPDKVIFTGSSAVGSRVLHRLADTATPAVAELSGVDAVIVLPGADLDHTARAIAFGLRLNGAQVCMSPRRVIATQATLDVLLPVLRDALATIAPVELPAFVATPFADAVAEAVAGGARLHGACEPARQRPLVIENVPDGARLLREDFAAPVISLLPAATPNAAIEIANACPFGLTVSLFAGAGETAAVEDIASQVRAGVVLVNDLIAPTADPRLPFGGRGASGFGVTRGAEGLLEMTAARVTIHRRGGRARHLDKPAVGDEQFLHALTRALHGNGLRPRLRAIAATAQTLRSRR